MAISRAQLVKELEPGLNALFGLEYDRYTQEHKEIFSMESSDRAFEEEVMLSGFGSAPTKSEGSAVTFDDAQEVYTARYTMETIALALLTQAGMVLNYVQRHILSLVVILSATNFLQRRILMRPALNRRSLILPGSLTNVDLK